MVFLSQSLPRSSLIFPYAIHVEAQIASQHQVNDHEEVLVILKTVMQIDDKRVPNLLQQDGFLDGIGDSLVGNTLRFVDVLQSIELPQLAARELSLHDSDLPRSCHLVACKSVTFPKDPFPTTRCRSKCRRSTVFVDSTYFSF